jgi:hypothetical protein
MAELKLKKFLHFVWFYCAPTQFMSNSTKTGNMILANLGCNKLKGTS